MFGRPRDDYRGVPQRRPAHEVAKIQGGGLVQVIVTRLDPMTFYLFLNDREVEQAYVDSLFVAVEAPAEGSLRAPNVTATLTHRVSTVTGQKEQQHTTLFPCTVEIIALGRRIAITAVHPDSLEGLWIDLGLKADGTSNEVSGARELQILLTQEILDANLTWNDGESEALFPRPAAPPL